MDCIENPYTWDQSRNCTFTYDIFSLSEKGTYQFKKKDKLELYYVGKSDDTNLI